MKSLTEEFKIKGMICSRCLKVLNNELEKTGAEVLEIQLGFIKIRYNPEKVSRSYILKVILENEFEILLDKDHLLVEQTKRWLIDYIRNSDLSINISDFLSRKLDMPYDKLGRKFTKIFGYTIERYCIRLKTERTKELIESSDMSLGEISFSLGYQNLSSLSRLFKAETGLTMKQYRNLGIHKRIPLDKI